MSTENDNQNPAPPSLISAATKPTEVSPVPDASVATLTASPVLNPTMLSRPEGLIGATIGERYFVEKEIGHGGIGAVYLAYDRRLMDKCVVVKVLLEKSLQDEWVTRKFLHEKEALTRVDHPGIVGILDAGELPDGKPYIVMQCVDGVTLRSVMQPEGMNLERAARLIQQAAEALGAVHEKGIFHRDLKPENMMLQQLGEGREQLKIIDFGIAKVKNSLAAPSTAVSITAGSFAYISPEQLSAQPVTAASDVYSLGVISYEMLTGRRPFNPESSFELLEMQRAGVRVRPQDLRPALPEAAANVILRALSFVPQQRYQRAREFGDELARAIETGASLSASDTEETTKASTLLKSTARAQPLPRSIPSWLFVAGALLVAAIVGVLVWQGLKSPASLTVQETNAPSAAPERTLNYWLTVQKIRDGKAYQQPFESSGQEIFENGWKFRVNIVSPQAGHLYLLNEGPTKQGASSFNLLYPTPGINSGSARLNANEKMQTGWYVFDEYQGTEKFWVIWSAEPVAELEAVKGVVNPQDKGEISDGVKLGAIRELLGKYQSARPVLEKDAIKKQTSVKGRGEVLLNRIELEHH